MVYQYSRICSADVSTDIHHKIKVRQSNLSRLSDILTDADFMPLFPYLELICLLAYLPECMCN